MTDRNDPCPCGSGKKYKKCCLNNQIPFPTVDVPRHVEQRGIRDLMALVNAWEPDAMIDCGEALMSSAVLDHLDEQMEEESEHVELVLGAYQEGILAELSRRGVLARYAYRLTQPQRAYLEELGRRWMRFYEVLEVDPGRSIRLRDEATDELVTVSERTASREVSVGMMLATRIVHDAPEPTMSFTMPFDRLEIVALRESLAGVPEAEADLALERAIIRRHLELGIVPADEPGYIDQRTGGELEFVVDSYKVRDRESLTAALDSCDDLDRTDLGDVVEWERIEWEGPHAGSALATLRLTEDGFEVSTTSRLAADGNRPWAEALVGRWIEHVSRTVRSPEEAWGGLPDDDDEDDSDFDDADDSDFDFDEEMSSPEFAREMDSTYRKLFKGWGDTPHPLFGNRTPREHARTVEGRKAVLDLVRSFQADEEQTAQAQGRNALDLSWVAALAGLDPSEV